MARRKIPHGCVIACDVMAKGCAERFTTYSFAAMARKQAKAAGWSRVSGKKFQGGSPELIISLQPVDVCPSCFATAPRYVKPKKEKKAKVAA